ncbi:MAG: DEAD/DEAH box helicase [Marinilabiliaceae bacterium]
MQNRKTYSKRLTQEFRDRIGAIESSTSYPTAKYREMNALMKEISDLLTADMPFAMSGTYAKIDYIVSFVCPDIERRVRTLRMHCKKWRLAGTASAHDIKSDIGTLHLMADLLSEERKVASHPDSVQDDTSCGWADKKYAKTPWRTMRVRVIDGHRLANVTLENADDGSLTTADLSAYDYLAHWLKRGTKLSLIYHNTANMPQLSIVIYEPDYLIDVTSITSCFTPYCISHRLFFIKQLTPNTSTRHTLLGNMAGQFLDESLSAIRNGQQPTPDYTASARLFFSNNALALAATPDITPDWHKEAQEQQRNVADALLMLKESDPLFSPRKASTEASLISADLGLRGRADLLQSDWNLLIEQKSGKMETFGHKGAKEDHYLQMMLYKTMLSVCYDNDYRSSSQYFLYSKYQPKVGLMREGSSMSKSNIYQTLEVRNAIVHDLIRFGDPVELRRELTSWTVDGFRQRQVSDRFWEPFGKKELERALVPIRNASQLAQAYFFEMLAFVIREDIESRIGGSSHGRNGFADLWNTDYADRESAGCAITGLRYKSMRRDEEFDTNGECSILTLTGVRDNDESTSSPNFRTGDPINLYDYAKGGSPDILKTIAHRATLLKIGEDGTVEVKLRSAQPPEIFNDETRLWAIDHDLIESSNMRTFCQLANVLRSTAERISLLLGTRPPAVDESRAMRLLDHGPMNALVERQLAAKEEFLLIGPPGTGKTSYGLMSILREELAREGHSILLLSYTNRAVDEICSKLEKDGLDYVRIGSRYACPESFRGRLLISQKFENTASVRNLVERTRIFVGTTASISGAPALFRLKRFDLAIVDEASQILEPSIVGILSETYGEGMLKKPSIARFILIGDQKQLPAVVQQNSSQSAVKDDRLKKISLLNCRDSFFERMIRLHGTDPRLVFKLTRQGRMHPEVSDFSNRHFYLGELSTIPLQHQTADLDLSPELQEHSTKTCLLATRRTLYVNSHSAAYAGTAQDKVNPHEADIVADIAIRILKIYTTAGKEPCANKTLGIVVPYRNQITAIKTRLLTSDSLPDSLRPIAQNLTIDTVERFQGSERDVIIYGLTVTHPSQLEFLKDSTYDDADGSHVDRKLNVALTRAREQLIVVGDLDIMQTDTLYSELAVCMNKGIEVGDSGIEW